MNVICSDILFLVPGGVSASIVLFLRPLSLWCCGEDSAGDPSISPMQSTYARLVKEEGEGEREDNLRGGKT